MIKDEIRLKRVGRGRSQPLAADRRDKRRDGPAVASPVSFSSRRAKKGGSMDPSRVSQVQHLFEVEHLTRRRSLRRSACAPRLSPVSSTARRRSLNRGPPSSTLRSAHRGVDRRYPSLRAAQIRERLASYGWRGSHRDLYRFTEKYREATQGLPRVGVPAGRVAQ